MAYHCRKDLGDTAPDLGYELGYDFLHDDEPYSRHPLKKILPKTAEAFIREKKLAFSQDFFDLGFKAKDIEQLVNSGKVKYCPVSIPQPNQKAELCAMKGDMFWFNGKKTKAALKQMAKEVKKLFRKFKGVPLLAALRQYFGSTDVAHAAIIYARELGLIKQKHLEEFESVYCGGYGVLALDRGFFTPPKVKGGSEGFALLKDLQEREFKKRMRKIGVLSKP